MASSPNSEAPSTVTSSPAKHKPLVVGRTKPSQEISKDEVAAVNSGIENNIRNNTKSSTSAESPANQIDPSLQSQATSKKQKPPKQTKAPAATALPLSPALIDLRVGHILRCVAHPNADSLFVSTIALGDPPDAEHTHKDEETGKIVRTVCSGLNGLVPLAEMQDRKVIVVANLKPVTMRGIKSTAMVLAASPKPEEGADPHSHDRVIELVSPPEDAEAGEKVYFEGWPYGDGKGPEKVLNPKKKAWESIQPGFFTNSDCIVGFDASKTEGIDGGKGDLVVKGKGRCTVKTLIGAVVR